MESPMPEPKRQMWKVLIAAPIETVWNTLVKTDEVLPFLFGSVCDTENGLQAGKPMRMVTRDGRHVIAYGEVLEFTPPTRFSHAINFAMASEELTLISEAIEGTQTAKMAKSGSFIVANLKAQAETGRPALSGRLMLMMAPLSGLFTPSRCRAELWPLSRVPISTSQAY
jgi:uncharacterized protein YndB with AHSA1/START domain